MQLPSYYFTLGELTGSKFRSGELGGLYSDLTHMAFILNTENTYAIYFTVSEGKQLYHLL